MATVADAAVSNGDIMKRLRDMERMIQEMNSGRKMESSSIGKGGIRVDDAGVIRSTTFNGNMAAGDSGTDGWALGADRLAIDGVFLTPFHINAENAYATNFDVGTTAEAVVSVSLTPASWAEAVTIYANFSATARNDSAGAEIMYASTHIGATDVSGEISCDREPGLLAHVSVPGVVHSYVIDSGVVVVEGRLRSSVAFGTDPNNTAVLAVMGIYRRFSSDVD